MKIIFHADDYGLSKGITDNILLCHDQGILHRVSLMANGYAYDYACEELLQRPNLAGCVHLNLIEGEPLTKAHSLTNKSSGLLNLTFLSILRADDKMKQLIVAECLAQIRRISQSLSMKYVEVDSHQHCHMVPWLFQELIKQSRSLKIRRIRCACDQNSISDFFRTKPMSLAKNTLLKLLYQNSHNAYSNQQVLQENKELFWGLLYTGQQNYLSLERCYQRIKNCNKKTTLEVLLHPGQAKIGEEFLWKHYPKLLKYYYSIERIEEQQTLLSLAKSNHALISITN